MEKNLNGEGFPEQLFSVNMTKEEAGAYSPLVLAFIGDAVFELFVRTALVKEGNATPNKLNRRKNLCVKASAQAALMDRIEPLLTEEEERIFHRGRNAKPATMAKNATVRDYHRATGFEALVGWLYLSGQEGRLAELIGGTVK